MRDETIEEQDQSLTDKELTLIERQSLILNLDKQIKREQGIIHFIELGGVLGDYTAVESDLLGLSFLQEKINRAGKNIAVTMA